jgi:hypothetical protein
MAFPVANFNSNELHQDASGKYLLFRSTKVSVERKQISNYQALTVTFTDACFFVGSIFPSHSEVLTAPSGGDLFHTYYPRNVKNFLVRNQMWPVHVRGQPAVVEVRHLRYNLSLELMTTYVEIFDVASFFIYLESIYRLVSDVMPFLANQFQGLTIDVIKRRKF